MKFGDCVVQEKVLGKMLKDVAPSDDRCLIDTLFRTQGVGREAI